MGELFALEQMTGIEPACLAWEASALPLSYICVQYDFSIKDGVCQERKSAFFVFLKQKHRVGERTRCFCAVTCGLSTRRYLFYAIALSFSVKALFL